MGFTEQWAAWGKGSGRTRGSLRAAVFTLIARRNEISVAVGDSRFPRPPVRLPRAIGSDWPGVPVTVS
jgi:hypothetical protein